MVVIKVFIKEKAPETDDIRLLRRILEDIIHEGYRVEFIDPDTPLGKGIAEAYDVLAPAVLILRENGSEVMAWRGTVPKNAGDIRYFIGHQVSKIAPSRTALKLKRGKPIKEAKEKPAPGPRFPAKKERKTIKRGKKSGKEI